jgi:predicted fused transcriptional regulator/phosphomethylpyrimidine kinase
MKDQTSSTPAMDSATNIKYSIDIINSWRNFSLKMSRN